MEDTGRPKMLRTATGRSEIGVTWQAPPLNACITTFSPKECMFISESKSTLAPCRLGVCAAAVSPTRNTKADRVFLRPPRCQNGAVSHFRQITPVIFLLPLSTPCTPKVSSEALPHVLTARSDIPFTICHIKQTMHSSRALFL